LKKIAEQLLKIKVRR